MYELQELLDMNKTSRTSGSTQRLHHSNSTNSYTRRMATKSLHTADSKAHGGAGPEVTLLAMNLSGRFAGREIRRFGEAVLGTVLVEKDADLMFGQQANFKPRLPEHYVLLGGTKGFLAFNKARLKACDEKQFRSKLRDLQFAGKLPFHYLPLTNFTITKFKTRRTPAMEFIAISWLSDETHGRLRNISLFKKLMAFVVNVSALEELPVVVAGTFNISLEEASENLPADYCVYGYIPYNVRRQVRAANFFVCPRAVRLGNVRPILCSNLQLDDCTEMWLNPEDAFYCDPVRATLVAEPQEAETNLHAQRFDQDELGTDYRDEPEGRSYSPTSSSMVPRGESPALEERDGGGSGGEQASTQQSLKHGLLKKLPSCPDLYDDTAAENGTTCYMS